MGSRAHSAADGREHPSGTLSVTSQSLIRGGGAPYTFTAQGPAARGSIQKEPRMSQSEATGSSGQEQGTGFGAHRPTGCVVGEGQGFCAPYGLTQLCDCHPGERRVGGSFATPLRSSQGGGRGPFAFPATQHQD